ncbi:MAG: DUF5916 domain-containing protein, partial [Pseudomonadota bacterium]
MKLISQASTLLITTVLLATVTVVGAEEIVVDLGPGDKIVVQQAPDDSIKLDGKLDEGIWQQLPAYDEFVVIEPDTLANTPYATKVRFLYDNNNLYVGVDMEQPAETLIARLSGRDSRLINRDNINITLDTSGEGRYGFWFGINLGDSLMDGTLLPERQFSSDWDGAWRGASTVTEKGWSAEFQIPWGIVTMPPADKTRRIGMYMSRKVAHVDERWGWPGLSSTVPKFISALQTLEVEGVEPRQQYSVYPFAAVTSDRVKSREEYRVGADIFWRPSTDFQLTATINPDFGNVESDEVVINLTATETFFPEKRLFFLENQGIFVATPRSDTRGTGVGSSGSPTTLVNTRRIGGKPVAREFGADVIVPERELLQPVELFGAVKLTGQYGRFRYGVLSAFEDDVEFEVMQNGSPLTIEGPGSDYGIVRVLYEDAPGGAYRAVGMLSTAVLHDAQDAFAHGIDGHYLSENGKLKIDGQVFISKLDDIDTGVGGFVDFEYTFRKGVRQRLGISYFDETVDINALGFLQRNDSFRIRSAHTRTNSNLSWARDNEFDVRGFVQKNSDDLFTGGGVFFSNRTVFNNLSRLTLRFGAFPEIYDDLNSFGNGAYRIEERIDTSIAWESDSSQKISYGFKTGFKDENLGGDSYTAGANLTWRPNDRFNVTMSADFQDRKGWLLHQERKNFTTFEAKQW